MPYKPHLEFSDVQQEKLDSECRTSGGKSVQEQLSKHFDFRKLKCCYNAGYLKSIHMFALALIFSEILNLKKNLP